MKKSKVILAVTIILALAVTGCGTNNSNAEKSQKETVAKVTDDKKADSQNKASLKTTEKSEEAELETEETIVKEDSTSDTNSSSGGNTTGNSNSSTTSGNHNNSGNTASSSGNSGSGNSGSGNNANSSNGNNGSSGNNNTFDNNTNQGPTPTPQHEHTWTHVDATGHYETVTIQAAWDETIPVYDDVAHDICNQCGADITGNALAHNEAHLLAYEPGGWHTEWRYEQTGTQTIHHDAVTEQRWVQDIPAYDVCSGCGATR